MFVWDKSSEDYNLQFTMKLLHCIAPSCEAGYKLKMQQNLPNLYFFENRAAVANVMIFDPIDVVEYD